MDSAWRIEYDGACYHLLSRGNERREIFVPADYSWNIHFAYAYGRRVPEWLSTEPILGQLKVADPRRVYRQKVHRYADEETRLGEDFRHGFILGSKELVASIRIRFLPDRQPGGKSR